MRKNRDKLRAIGFNPRALGNESNIREDCFLNIPLADGALVVLIKIRGRIEIQPRFKIQYPMKNHNKDALYRAKRCMVLKKISCVIIRILNNYKPARY